MRDRPDNPYAALKCVFHEPNRLAILSELCTAVDGLSFSALKAACDLTDGNLSRHLRMLEEASIVAIKKEFVGAKPRTTVYLTQRGREDFISYLMALEEVLKLAGNALEETPDAVRPTVLSNLKTAQV
jgi:DNA-binding HxlR family transcriptional regulator